MRRWGRGPFPIASVQVCPDSRFGPYFGSGPSPSPSPTSNPKVPGPRERWNERADVFTTRLLKHALTLAWDSAAFSSQSLASVHWLGTDREIGLGLLGKAGADGEIAVAINPSLPGSALRGAGTRAGGVNS